MKNLTAEECSFLGVYIIINTQNKKSYIGSSTNIYQRLRRHLSDLRKNRHSNSLLQKDFNNYGEDKFIARVIVKSSLDELRDDEQYYLDLTESDYNIIKDCITNSPSPSMRIKISNTVKEKVRIGLIKIPDKSRFRKIVYKFDLEGNYIQKYNSIEEAAKMNNVFSTSISENCRNPKRAKKVGNYIYSYTDKINIENYKNKQFRSVSIINTETNELFNFLTINDCVNKLHIPISCLRRLIDNPNRLYKTYKLYNGIED